MSSSDRGSHLKEVASTRGRPADARRMAEALAEPLRGDIFDVLAGWKPTATAAQIAEFLGESPEAVARQLAILEECDLVEPLTGPPARPGDTPPYRATREGFISDEEWAEFPPELRRRLFARLLEKMNERIRSALGEGGFDEPEVHVSWLPTDLDGIGYSDMVRLLAETLNRARDIQVAAVERRAAGSADDEEIKSSVMLVHFLDDAASAAQEESTPALEQAFALADAIGDEVAAGSPDWHRLADAATALAALARRRAGASVVR